MVDLTGYEIGQSIHLSAIELPAGVKPKARERNVTLATIGGRLAEEAPTIVAEPAEGEAAAGAAAPSAGDKKPDEKK